MIETLVNLKYVRIYLSQVEERDAYALHPSIGTIANSCPEKGNGSVIVAFCLSLYADKKRAEPLPTRM